MENEDWTKWEKAAASDPIDDLQELFKRLKYERWICKGCAWWTHAPPNSRGALIILKCPECGSEDFHYTYEPYDHEK